MASLDTFYSNKVEGMKLDLIRGQAVLRRLEAQRNELNSRVRLLREELGLLQQPGSYVGEVVKVMGTKKVLVKVHPEGKYGESYWILPLCYADAEYSRGHRRQHRHFKAHSRQTSNTSLRQLQTFLATPILSRSSRLAHDGGEGT